MVIILPYKQQLDLYIIFVDISTYRQITQADLFQAIPHQIRNQQIRGTCNFHPSSKLEIHCQGELQLEYTSRQTDQKSQGFHHSQFPKHPY
ncbi:hypothetical protein FR483_n456R [Paramecium bursaria Chlorella virus FR483]|uniref:Uncharacterized protein n456R n=1 Tax=Paramecium bursaria Chlorella virus FR483 TaxID=399781 RepID=A7J7G0_PBCVF|nr:hypothetical protein FR483_n456R [Paramecium bursaria Chlorella virus FR483]ABT15741.1 hypothetical protein FR483_n456R [Paramecium bursaria Chlorella virus FR483]